MKKREVRNLLALAVLSYLVQGPMHPYELGRTLREHGDDRSIKFNHGSLYMVMRQLADAGYIAELETSREGQRPERTVYALTDPGRAELRDWLQELLSQPTHEYPTFVTALSFMAALRPAEAVNMLRERIDRLREQRDEIREAITAAEDVHPLFLVEEEYRLAVMDAEVSFVMDLIARITDERDGWAPQWDVFHTSQSQESS